MISLSASIATASLFSAAWYIAWTGESSSMTVLQRSPFPWINLTTFILLLFFAIRFMMMKMTKPFFSCFSHHDRPSGKPVDGTIALPPASHHLPDQPPTPDDLKAQLDEQREQAARFEELYRTVVECSSEMMYWVSADRKTVRYVSPHCRDLIGYEPEDFYRDATLLDRIVHPDFRQHWQERRHAMTSPFQTELALVTSQGRTVWVTHTCRPVCDRNGVHSSTRGSFSDISHIRESDRARQASEEALRLQNDYLRALHETTLGLIGRLEIHGLLSAIIARAAALMETEHGFICLLNEEKAEMEARVRLGFFETLEPTILRRGEGIPGYVWEQDRPCATADFRQWVSGPDLSRYAPLRATAGVPLTSGGEVIGIIGLSYTDPDKRFDDGKMQQLRQFAELASLALDNARLYDSARAELEQRAKAEERLRKLSQAVMQCPVSIMITDLNGTIEFANPQVSRACGYETDDLMGKNTRMLTPGLTSEAKYKNLWETILSGRQWRGELQNRHKNGRLYWERALISPVRDTNGAITHFITIQEDISDLKILEDQVRHSQKMEAIGQLAGGVAHDFNNILTAILGYGNILLMKLSNDSPCRKTAEQILAAAERGAGLTQGLLTFSRKQASNQVRMDLNDTVVRVEKLLATLIGDTSALVTHLSEDPLPVMADRMQIEQVLINLATNVRDSMPEGGTVTLSTEAVQLDSTFASSYGFGNGRFVLLTMSDTGHGMDEETLKRIFEPFYTTKETGKGTGLGLSIVYGIIKKHNGHILCTSKPGEGSCFSIYLPFAEDAQALSAGQQPPAPPCSVPSPAAPPIPSDRCQLLLVDPDAGSRHTTRTLLEEFGYRVIEAQDTTQAAQHYRIHKENIRMVILDSTPGCQEIVNTVPREKILFCCNAQDDILDSSPSAVTRRHILTKPFPPKELLMKLSEVLQDAR